MITPSFALTATERVLPKLALDFTTATLDARVTFTRSGATATAVNSSGYVALVAVDTPRFDYNPVTLICKGLLIEESRTNLFTYSEDFTGWTFSQASVVSSAVISPANDLTTTKLLENTATAQHLVRKSISVTSGTSYTVSIYAQKAERDWLYIVGGGNAGAPSAYFDLTNGVVGTVGSGTVATISDAGNGFYRCTISKAATVTGSALFSFAPATGNGGASYAGNDPSTDPTGIYIWGAQLEAGAFPTSYIPTTTAQVTRTADVATMTGTDFSDWFNASEGTFVATATVPAITGLNMRFISANDGTSSNRIDLSGITNTQLRVVNSGSVQASVTSGSIASYQERTSVGAYKANSFATATNADAISVATSGTVPTVDQLYIGRATVSSATYCNGTIKQINYWQQRLTDNEVVAFSKGL
jgi:hypothetical protein